MLERGQILLSIEHLTQEADTHIANFNFDWEKARANVPIPKGSQVDRQEWDKYLKQELSPMLPPTGYLPGFLDKVKRLLADIGTPGDPSLRRVLKLCFPADDPDRCVRSLRVVKVELERVKGMEFLGVQQSPHLRRKSRQKPTRPRPKSLSDADRERCVRIGIENIKRMTNPELHRRYFRQEQKLRPHITPHAFRQSLNRIRTFHKLPTSLEVRKKVTKIGQSESDQE